MSERMFPFFFEEKTAVWKELTDGVQTHEIR